jgi:hypothetical protein
MNEIFLGGKKIKLLQKEESEQHILKNIKKRSCCHAKGPKVGMRLS